MIRRYLAQGGELANASIGEQNVDGSSFLIPCRKEPVKIDKSRDVALNAREFCPPSAAAASNSPSRGPVMNT